MERVLEQVPLELSVCLPERAISMGQEGDACAHRPGGAGRGHSESIRKESLVISSFLRLGRWWEPLLLFFLLV